MQESSLDSLKALTESFFSKHWNRDMLGDPPTWSERYAFEGSLPNHNMQGVYAFLKEDIVTYVGVGTALGGGRYAGHGLGKRFQSYTKVINGAHIPTDPRLVEAGSMVTIGFPQEYAYLANALELYLIGRMETQHNVHRPGRAVQP
ncbi:hypothetical protein [Halomonas rhizosphaerae]|uniref:Uncharacterized protein n=1 Tax=Halomonas rhizosphaerae TaxID=3043296 RepID=A0ABT6UXL7_9GAMM|nr:hypothetical protein [Halomonas rhizosphaerae]MDI5890728.1 hypothetical protein [Halomonas rhizosphaerae]